MLTRRYFGLRAARVQAMNPADPTTGVIAHAIQLSIAPVFLLTGISGLLGVMANRLARVIDRARTFEKNWRNLDAHAKGIAMKEIHMLERRRRTISWSINFCTIAALLICLVIVSLFVEEFFGRNLKLLASSLFVLAMISVICGLSCFLREVYLATHTTSIDPRRFDDSKA
jgi:hypothetical protein